MDPQLNPRPGPVTPGLCLSAAVTTEGIRCKVNGGSSSCCRAQRWRHRDQSDAVEIGLCCERLQWSDVWTRVVSVEVEWWTPTLDPVLRAAGNKQQITDRAAAAQHDCMTETWLDLTLFWSKTIQILSDNNNNFHHMQKKLSHHWSPPAVSYLLWIN